MKKLFYIILLINFNLYGQVIMPVQSFNADVLLHANNTPFTSWYAPDYNPPVDWYSSGGNPGGYIGYSGSWNNLWCNLIRLPQSNCVGHDTVILSFDMSNSYFASYPLDYIRFYIWDQGAASYEFPVAHIKINGVESMEIFGVNGYGFRFNEPHNWAHVEVFFCMNQVVTKANVLFFLEPSCNYNNSNVYSVKFDNIQLTAPDNIFTNMEVNDNKLPDYTVFPTVFQNAVTIKINNDSGKLKVVLLDSFGKQVLLENVNLNNDNYELQIPDLASGIYYLVLISNEGKVCKKLFH